MQANSMLDNALVMNLCLKTKEKQCSLLFANLVRADFTTWKRFSVDSFLLVFFHVSQFLFFFLMSPWVPDFLP